MLENERQLEAIRKCVEIWKDDTSSETTSANRMAVVASILNIPLGDNYRQIWEHDVKLLNEFLKGGK